MQLRKCNIVVQTAEKTQSALRETFEAVHFNAGSPQCIDTGKCLLWLGVCMIFQHRLMVVV